MGPIPCDLDCLGKRVGLLLTAMGIDNPHFFNPESWAPVLLQHGATANRVILDTIHKYSIVVIAAGKLHHAKR
ncbi:hypothetical protein BDV26DRAFT_260902 [Aspergillus bertholletiae]|uniref:Uncharacterized protein n=1 Tax=Aspergillus bertholletiae TaxID=1226010 RepID=A0A5N7BAK9_9EURO|nr:hypothetical protein BDV26DRAFT_260902 [Aspergillus bertholletiae]